MNTHFHCVLDSPIGPLTLAGDGHALSRILFPKDKAAAAPPAGSLPRAEPFRDAIRQLEEYFAGRRQRFELRLAPRGTAFQCSVWTALQAIPFGETESYAALARRIGRASAMRAVGAANGRNPLPIVVPCHRVIGADGSLTGFGGGLPTKAWLLRHEARVGGREAPRQAALFD